jgi:hypothetical protein
MFSGFRDNRNHEKVCCDSIGSAKPEGFTRVLGLDPCDAEPTLRLFAATVMEIEQAGSFNLIFCNGFRKNGAGIQSNRLCCGR